MFVFWYGLSLSNASTAMMVEYLMFKDLIMSISLMILLFVGGVISYYFMKLGSVMCYLENKTLEVVWTMMPGLLLILIAFPSLKLLYFLDYKKCFVKKEKVLAWKVVGHQWYWSFECSFLNLIFDSYMKSKNDSIFKLLEVKRPFVGVFGWMNKIYISSSDVIHSFSLPTFGVKIDAVPGRIKSAMFEKKVHGKFFGQCSEICGANHSFMPMSYEVMSSDSL